MTGLLSLVALALPSAAPAAAPSDVLVYGPEYTSTTTAILHGMVNAGGEATQARLRLFTTDQLNCARTLTHVHGSALVDVQPADNVRHVVEGEQVTVPATGGASSRCVCG